jgi:hypothetical protein
VYFVEKESGLYKIQALWRWRDVWIISSGSTKRRVEWFARGRIWGIHTTLNS